MTIGIEPWFPGHIPHWLRGKFRVDGEEIHSIEWVFGVEIFCQSRATFPMIDGCRGVAGTAGLLAAVTRLLISLPSPAVASAQIIPGTDLEAAEIVADLPWSFEVSEERSGAQADERLVQTTLLRFKSSAPYEQGPDGPTYLRVTLSTFEYDTASAAESAYDDLLASADPATGLSYAWDHVFVNGTMIYRLHAPCLFSEGNFRKMVADLENALRRQAAGHLRVATCRCGFGCQAMPEEAEKPAE